jgi:hypothetical protein
MAGAIKRMVDKIVEGRAKGNPTIEMTTRTKIILKGIDPDKFDDQSEDDPEILASLKRIASDLGVEP